MTELKDTIQFCAQCGEKLNKGSKFCRKCGAKAISETASFRINNIIKPQLSKNKVKEQLTSLIEKIINSKRNKYIIAASFTVLIIAGIIYSINEAKPNSVAETKTNTQSETTAKNPKQAIINITQVNTENFPVVKVYFSVSDNQNNKLTKLDAKYFKLSEKSKSTSYEQNIDISDLNQSNNNGYELTYTAQTSKVSSDSRILSFSFDGDGYLAQRSTEYMPKQALENTNGNTNGNVVNLGLVTKQNDWIYYANWTSQNSGIYKVKADGTGWTKLTSNKARSLNVIGEWIYYENVSDTDVYVYNNNKITTGKMYRMKTDGTYNQIVTNEKGEYFLPGVISVVGDWAYITNRKDNESIFRVNIKSNQSEKLNSDFSCNINVVGNYIYYGNMNDGDKLYRLDLTTKKNVKMVDVDSRSINVTENGIYYVDTKNNETISRLESNNTITKLVANAWPINVNGNYVYYCSNSQLWKVNINGSNPMKIFEVDASYINVIDNWIYYINNSDSKLYKVDSNGSSNQLVQF